MIHQKKKNYPSFLIITYSKLQLTFDNFEKLVFVYYLLFINRTQKLLVRFCKYINIYVSQ